MLLTGNFRRSLDDKLRVAIPKQLRDAIGFPDKTSLYVAPGTDQALVLYTADVLDEIGKLLQDKSPAAKQTRAFSRLFYAQAQPAEIDRQGRLRLPPDLASLAKLDGEVVVIGVRDRIEIWAADRWDKFLKSTQPSYDDLAEEVFAPGETL